MGAHFIFLTVYFCFGQLKFYFKVKLKQGLVRKGNESGVGGVCVGLLQGRSEEWVVVREVDKRPDRKGYYLDLNSLVLVGG